MRGFNISIWPFLNRMALLSGGLPPRSTKLPLFLTARTPRACERPTSVLSNEMYASIFGVLIEPVVGDDLHACIVGRRGGGGRGIAVFGDDDQGVDAQEDHVFDLVVLQLFIVVGDLGNDLRALVVAELGEQRRLDRPALGAKSEKERPIFIFAPPCSWAFARSCRPQRRLWQPIW